MKRRIVTAVAIGVLASALPLRAQPAAEPETLTLDAAVALALANNRQVAMAALDVERADHKVAAARTRMLPSFEVQGNAGTPLTPLRMTFPEGAFGTFPGIGPVPAADTAVEAPRSFSGYVSATVAQPLTQLYRASLNTRLNELSRDAEKAELRAQRAAVAADVRRLYYGLLQSQAAVAAAEEAVNVLQEAGRVVAIQVSQETALEYDELDVKARLASAQYDLLRLRDDLLTRQEQMNHVLGRDIARPFQVGGVPEPGVDEADLPSATSLALARRPEVVHARVRVDMAETDRRLKRAEAIPEVSVAVSYASFVNVDLLPANFAQAAVQVKWEPFDWGRRRREQAEKALAVLQARSGEREAESQARLEVAQRFRQLQEARLLLEARTLARQAGHEKVRLVADRHREEAALLRDLLDAQASAAEADARWVDAVVAVHVARVELRKAMGEDD